MQDFAQIDPGAPQMNPLTLAAIGLIAVILAVTGIRMLLAIGTNFAIGRQVRAGLRHRVTRLRLGRMLARRGIELDSYLHEVPMTDLEGQIRACENCEQTTVCNRTLAKGGTDSASEFGFCPNDATLTGYKDKAERIAVMHH